VTDQTGETPVPGAGTGDGTPAAFTDEVYAARMERTVYEAAALGLSGVLVTPSPDLVWLCGYRPTTPTERLTLLVLTANSQPRLLVPAIDRPSAEAAPGAGAVRVFDWWEGQDAYAAAAGLLRPHGRYAVSDATWALHLLCASAGAASASWPPTWPDSVRARPQPGRLHGGRCRPARGRPAPPAR
jgi:Xaa-Pro aminopeptidase